MWVFTAVEGGHYAGLYCSERAGITQSAGLLSQGTLPHQRRTLALEKKMNISHCKHCLSSSRMHANTKSSSRSGTYSGSLLSKC